MVFNDDLEKQFSQVMNYLEDALKTIRERDDLTLSKKIWKIGVGLEYLLFLIGLSRPNSEEECKESEKMARTGNIEYELLAVKSLLKEATSALLIDIEEGYKKVWFAQGHLLRVQRALEKTKVT